MNIFLNKAILVLFSFLTVLYVNNSAVAENKSFNFLNKAELSSFPEMLKKRHIRALVVYSKTDFFFENGRARGIQTEYLNLYEKFLNKKIKKPENKIHIVYIPVTFSDLIPALLSGKGDIAASFLTITPKREKKVLFATAGAFKVNEVLVSYKDAKPIEKLTDLSGKSVYVLKNSSYIEHLQKINVEFKKNNQPIIKIEVADEQLLGEDILELVNSGVKQYTVIDDYKATLWARVLPNIKLNKNIIISKNNTIGWAVRKENKKLQYSLNQFAQTVKKGTLLGNMFFSSYFKNTKWIKNPNTDKEQKKLKAFIHLFKKYGTKYQFDHLALLAQAFQESGLDNSKKSHRGAIGIMQLLPSTAADKNVGIKDISSIEANIHAGTKYLAFVRDRYYSSPEISNSARFAFSWAAYNAGPASVRKMRALTKKMGLNENIWFNNVEVAAGKIIGRETVDYVAHIYKYYIAYKLSQQLL